MLWPGGGTPKQNDRDACQKSSNEALKGTKILFSGRGLKIMFFNPKRYQCKTTHYLLSTLFTLRSVYSTSACGAEQTIETIVSN